VRTLATSFVERKQRALRVAHVVATAGCEFIHIAVRLPICAILLTLSAIVAPSRFKTSAAAGDGDDDRPVRGDPCGNLHLRRCRDGEHWRDAPVRTQRRLGPQRRSELPRRMINWADATGVRRCQDLPRNFGAQPQKTLPKPCP